MNDLIKQENEALKGVDPSKAAQIKAVFEPMTKMLEDFESAYNEVIALEITPEACATAKRLRLDIAKIRVSADKARKSQKEEYLRAGQAIQGVYNILKFAVTDKEEKLKEMETFYERIEAEKITKLANDRAAALAAYEKPNALEDLPNSGTMAADVWQQFFNGIKLNYEAVKAAELKAEQDRIEREEKEALFSARKMDLSYYADFIDIEALTQDTTESVFKSMLQTGKERKEQHEKEQEKIKKENAKLKREAEKKAAAVKAEQEKRDAAAAAEVERLEAIAAEETIKAAKLQEEKDAREAEELRKAEAAKEARKAAEAAPDKERLEKLIELLVIEYAKINNDEAALAVNMAILTLKKGLEGLRV